MDLEFSRTGIFDFPNLIQIFRYTDRNTCRALRCVSRTFYETGMHPTLKQLTNRQMRVLDQIEQLTKEKFRRHALALRDGKKHIIPKDYVVTSGTGTGKTLMGLYTIKMWYDEGHTIIICTSPTQFYIWEDEYKKWQKRYDLPDMKVLHQDYLKKGKLPEIQPGDVLMISDGVRLRTAPRPHTFSAHLIKLLNDNKALITRAIMDETDRLPNILKSVAIENDEFYGIVMNASRPIKSGIGAKEGHLDGQLPSKPTMNVHIQTITDANLKDYYDANRGEQNLITYEHEHTAYLSYQRDVLRLFQLGFLRGKTNILNKDTGKKRITVLKQFKEKEITELVAPITFISKGHNIYPDTLFILCCSEHTQYKRFYQLLGRIYRYGSPWKHVNVHILIPNTNVQAYGYYYQRASTYGFLTYLMATKFYQMTDQNIEACLIALNCPYNYYFTRLQMYETYSGLRRVYKNRMSDTRDGSRKNGFIIMLKYLDWFITNVIGGMVRREERYQFIPEPKGTQLVCFDNEPMHLIKTEEEQKKDKKEQENKKSQLAIDALLANRHLALSSDDESESDNEPIIRYKL